MVAPGLVDVLMTLVEPDECGDPESPLRWTTKSLRHLAEELSPWPARAVGTKWRRRPGRTTTPWRRVSRHP
jgi:hypothetical protein